MPSILHRFPQEILTRIARESAISTGSGLPTAPSNLSRVDKTLHCRLALSSIFRSPGTSFSPDTYLHPAALTHPLLWADIFKDNFSSSAVCRRSFTPSIDGYAIQLVVYCRLLRWLRTFDLSMLKFKDSDPDSFHNTSLEIIFLMLLECDGRNTCQLEWAGAYEYCKQWLHVKLFPVNGESGKLTNCWPREDRYVAYALWNTWLLTTHDRLAVETPAESTYFQDLLFRFSFCSWRYPHSYAPLSRYTLPLDPKNSRPGSSTTPRTIIHTSFASILPYPVYRSYNASPSSLQTKPTTVPYFGSFLSWSPPLLTSAAKLLYNCRADSVPLRPPDHLPQNREIFFQQHRANIQRKLAENPTLAALYDLIRVRGVGSFDWMVSNYQLPSHISVLPGLQQAIYEVNNITGMHGINPAEAVRFTQMDAIQANAHRETALPFRGGWNEDGDDPHNRKWSKTLIRDKNAKRPPARHMPHIGLPYSSRHMSTVHDSFFWRLRMCGDPSDQHRSHIFDFLTPRDLSQFVLDHTLRQRWNHLIPGRTWTPGLLDGLFQGAFWYPPEGWLLNSYRSTNFDLPDIGENITSSLTPTVPMGRHHFIGRLQEHHLRVGGSAVPFTCDSRTFPRNTLSPGQGPMPIIAFAESIDPGEELTIDEGGMNAWMPANFRCSHGTTDGKSVARFACGPKGTPSPDRVTEYETFVPGQESSHRPGTCPACQQRTEFLQHIGEQKEELTRAEDLFRQVGLSPSSDSERASPSTRSHSPHMAFPCDGIADIIVTGETDLEHGQAWYHFNYLGRVRKWDGLVCILRIPKHPYAGLPTMLFYGYFESDLNFVGSWRLVAGDRVLNPNLSVPTIYLPADGLNGIGLLGRGGAGVLGDSMRVVQEGPFTMSKVLEDDL